MDTEAWQRLAAKLTERRASLRPEWADRTAFARDNQLSYRSLSDLETARRDNYKASWLTRIEHAYRWQPGSIQRVLAGAEPIPTETPSDPCAPSDAAPLAASVSAWDETIVGPQGVVDETEVLMWRDTPTGREYRLADASDVRIHSEYEFPPGETVEQVIDDLRRLLAPHRANVTQMRREREKRRAHR